MEAALIAGAVTVGLWVLSRIPGFTRVARVHSRAERDLRILEKLPPGDAHDLLSESIQRDVVRMLDLRAPRPETPMSILIRSGTASYLEALVGFILLTYPAIGIGAWFMAQQPDRWWEWVLLVLATGFVVLVIAPWSLRRIRRGFLGTIEAMRGMLRLHRSILALRSADPAE